MLVVNLATIGDYILFRNFLEYVKEEYPPSIQREAYYVLPDKISKKLDRFNELKRNYRYGSDIDINSISPDTVKTEIATIFRAKH